MLQDTNGEHFHLVVPPWPVCFCELVLLLSPGCFQPPAAPAWPLVLTGEPPDRILEAQPFELLLHQALHPTCPEKVHYQWYQV